MDQLKPSVNTNTDSLVFPANENVCVAVGILAILAMIICPAWWKPRSTVSSVCDDRAQCKWWELFLLSKSLHSLGPAWPALRVFTSHLEMKHHHVFIIKHSHSHIATHEDVPRPNSDQITCRAWHFIWLKKKHRICPNLSSWCPERNVTSDFLITFWYIFLSGWLWAS